MAQTANTNASTDKTTTSTNTNSTSNTKSTTTNTNTNTSSTTTAKPATAKTSTDKSTTSTDTKQANSTGTNANSTTAKPTENGASTTETNVNNKPDAEQANDGKTISNDKVNAAKDKKTSLNTSTDSMSDIKSGVDKKVFFKGLPKHSKMNAEIAKANFKEVVELGRQYSDLKPFADVMARHAENIGKAVNPEEYVRFNYSVYTSGKNILEEKDFSKFSIKFKYYLTLMCKSMKDNNINEVTFLKHDSSWKWGAGEFTRFHSLVTLIFATCNYGVVNVSKKINIDKATQGLSPVAKNNIQLFFNK